MEKNLEPVFTTDKEYKMNIITALFKENNIEYNVINKQDSMYKIGEIEVYVDEADFEEAKEIVNKAEL